MWRNTYAIQVYNQFLSERHTMSADLLLISLKHTPVHHMTATTSGKMVAYCDKISTKSGLILR